MAPNGFAFTLNSSLINIYSITNERIFVDSPLKRLQSGTIFHLAMTLHLFTPTFTDLFLRAETKHGKFWQLSHRGMSSAAGSR